ncbi:MAG: 7-cyano-7-deazaguanine synthase QueC [Phycisphaerae bacterium]|jgi:7-cyano-7-deazaguanine synthase|nr:7-cyano-7-deazaguanine synthase QueC [Phycisphaerae bacterium]|tara:strand:+ start:223 stop:876 length:654 start_codon:yes stop_codon:yes gene_type:complete
MGKSAVILLSGGLDSATVLAIANEQEYDCHALSFSYGQRHFSEIESSKLVASHLGVAEHVISEIDLSAWGGSALTGDIAVPKDGEGGGIPVTYVPARNTIFLSHALGFAEAIGSRDIFIGVNSVDYSGYPDCRGEFIESFQAMANLATKAGVEGDPFTIHAPLLEMTKVEIIQLGLSIGVDYSMTQSCYDPNGDGSPCGACDACRLRDAAFSSIGSM